MTLEERIIQWGNSNGYQFKSIEEKHVYFERLSDGYPMKVQQNLLLQIMDDDEKRM